MEAAETVRAKMGERGNVAYLQGGQHRDADASAFNAVRIIYESLLELHGSRVLPRLLFKLPSSARFNLLWSKVYISMAFKYCY